MTPESPPPASDSLARDLRRLEAIVHELEADDVELDRALTLFEEGVRCLQSARSRLAGAEARVQRVLEDGQGTISLTDFDV